MDGVMVKMLVGGIGAIVAYLFGGWSALLAVLLTFVVIDFITGWMAAGVEGQLKSKVSFRGIAKKVSIFLIVAAAHMVDTTIGDGHLIRDAVIFFYLANELLSIVENCGRIGLPVPDVIRQAVEVLRGKGGAR